MRIQRIPDEILEMQCPSTKALYQGDYKEKFLDNPPSFMDAGNNWCDGFYKRNKYMEENMRLAKIRCPMGTYHFKHIPSTARARAIEAFNRKRSFWNRIKYIIIDFLDK